MDFYCPRLKYSCCVRCVSFTLRDWWQQPAYIAVIRQIISIITSHVLLPRSQIVITMHDMPICVYAWIHVCMHLCLSLRPSDRMSVRSHKTPLLWLVFGTVCHYTAMSDYVADHTKQFQTISWKVSTCHVYFNFVGKKPNKHTRYGHLCPSVHVWTETTNTQVMVICAQLSVYGLFVLKKTHLWLILGTVDHFVAVLFYVQPHRKKAPSYWQK